MRVIYSIDARLGGGGIGNTACQAVWGIYRASHLALVFASSNAQAEIPSSLIRQWGLLGRSFKYLGAKDGTGLVYHFESQLYDAWVAARLPRGDIFHGWNGMCLRSLRQAKRRGMATIVERASSHPQTQFRLLREEYARWDIRLSLPSWHLPRLRRELNEADYVTVPSAFARDSLIAEGVPEAKVIEIPFGVDTTRYVPAPDPTPHPFRVIFAGQVSIRKGVPDLLESWRRLAWSDAELWIVGALSHDFAPLRQRWANLPGAAFIPHTSNLAARLQTCDLFAYPSIEEGSALVTYEAMACGLPVVTTPNAGSVVRDGEDGFIVPIRDVDALCDRLQCLRDDAALRARMSRSAREHVEQFTWSRYQAQLVAQYRRIAGE